MQVKPWISESIIQFSRREYFPKSIHLSPSSSVCLSIDVLFFCAHTNLWWYLKCSRPTSNQSSPLNYLATITRHTSFILFLPFTHKTVQRFVLIDWLKTRKYSSSMFRVKVIANYLPLHCTYHTRYSTLHLIQFRASEQFFGVVYRLYVVCLSSDVLVIT